MKRLVALTTLLLLVAGCSRSSQNDAVIVATEHWKLTQLGGSNYLCEIIAASKTVFELRDIKIAASTSTLSEADKLNGVEWGGQVHLEAGAFRSYNGIPGTTWSEWLSPPQAPMGYVDTLVVQKIKGKWDVSELGPSNVTFKKLINPTYRNSRALAAAC